MGRRYCIDLAPTAVTVAADLLEITPAANKPVRIIGVSVGQTSDFGDAQSEIISLQWVRGNTTAGSGGSSVTPTPASPGDAAASFTAKAFNTTQASAGTEAKGPRHLWNVQRLLERPLVPEETFVGDSSSKLVLRMGAAPADSLTIAGSVWVEEMGN